MMKPRVLIGIGLALLGALVLPAGAGEPKTPKELFSGALDHFVTILQVKTNEPPRTFTTTLKLLRAAGAPKELFGREFHLAFQAPDHLRLTANWEGRDHTVCRDGQEIWVHVPSKRFALAGSPDIPLFASNPERKDATPLGPIRLPVPVEQLLALPLIVDLEALPDETVGGAACHVFKATPKPEAVKGFGLPMVTLTLWVRDSDNMPLRIGYADPKGMDFQVELLSPVFETWPESKWKLKAGDSENVEYVARSHLTRFLRVALAMIGERVPALGPPTGERCVIAREGEGRLERIDGTRVLFLKGTPEEMGRQHGILMRREIGSLVDRILYGVGVGSSFEKGRWFMGEIEAAQARLNKFMDQRYYREMDAMADASGLQRAEVRLANFFPELFHCSGFALFGKATVGGQMYHGRILDYLRGMGLEQNAVVMVFQPDQGNAWVNVGYAGFVGSVTAMNEKHIAIGEMGGRGEGHWDGKPMAQLVREVMEKANTLDEAVEIMRKGPRTCEYYYVISDARAKRAVGIAATPDKFETVWPGQSHPQLPHAMKDTVLVSAGDRYEELARRVKEAYGKIDVEAARGLMRQPVCMTSNIHSALFAPDTLDLWVANADSENVAAHARYTHYNLAELLQGERTQ